MMMHGLGSVGYGNYRRAGEAAHLVGGGRREGGRQGFHPSLRDDPDQGKFVAGKAAELRRRQRRSFIVSDICSMAGSGMQFLLTTQNEFACDSLFMKSGPVFPDPKCAIQGL